MKKNHYINKKNFWQGEKFSNKKAGVPHVAGDLYGKGGRYVFILRGERWKGYLLIVAFLFVPVLLIGLESFLVRSFVESPDLLFL
jgi:hypothetical protein